MPNYSALSRTGRDDCYLYNFVTLHHVSYYGVAVFLVPKENSVYMYTMQTYVSFFLGLACKGVIAFILPFLQGAVLVVPDRDPSEWPERRRLL